VKEYEKILYTQLLDSGLFCLQMVDLIILRLLGLHATEPESTNRIKPLLLEVMENKKLQKRDISTIVYEYIINQYNKEDFSKEKTELLALLGTNDPVFNE
jgi:hypothetical protein